MAGHTRSLDYGSYAGPCGACPTVSLLQPCVAASPAHISYCKLLAPICHVAGECQACAFRIAHKRSDNNKVTIRTTIITIVIAAVFFFWCRRLVETPKHVEVPSQGHCNRQHRSKDGIDAGMAFILLVVSRE